MSTRSTIYFSGFERGDVHLYVDGDNRVYLDAPALAEPFNICSWDEFIGGMDSRLSLNIAEVLRKRSEGIAAILGP